MDVVRAWSRQLLGAGTAAAIVPVAVLAALVVVLAGTGGVGGLAALGQLVEGPRVSPATEPASAVTAGRELAPVAPPVAVPAAPSVVVAVAPRVSAPERPRTTRPAVTEDLTPGGTVEEPPKPPPPPPPPPPLPPPPPPPAAAQRPTLGDRVTGVGEALGQTVDEVVVVVERIIDGLGPPLQRIGDGLLAR